MKRKAVRLFALGMAVLMSVQVPGLSVRATETGELTQETVEAQVYEAVTATSGDFGVNNGLHWEYDTETKTVTVSGEDVPNVLAGYDENWNYINKVFPSDTEIIRFENCQITSNMYYFFAGLSHLKEIDFTGLTASNISRMADMFYSCSSLTNLDLSGFDTSNVTDMSFMFYGCSGLTNLDVSGFDTSNVTNMHSMFRSCSSLTNLDLSGFDTSNVTDMSGMFSYCSSLTNLDLSGFDTSNVTDMSYMFNGCNGLTNLDVSGLDTSNVTDMSVMFDGCRRLTNLDLSGFDTSNVTDMSVMFDGCRRLTNLDLSGFDTSNVTDMSWMFYDCSSLTNLDLSGFDTSNVTDMSYMFNECNGLTNLDVSGFDTSNVTNMIWMFGYCSSLTNLDLSGFDTSNVTDICQMFYACNGLTNLDLSGFDTSNVIRMSDMFWYCNGLTTLCTPFKMGDETTYLPATFYTLDGTSTTVFSKDFAGMILYKEGFVPEEPSDPEEPEDPVTPLAITTQPTAVEVKDGSQATFTVVATGDGLTYQWELCYAGDSTFRKCTFPGANTATLTVDATKARNGYSFRCVVTDERGNSITSEAAKLTVKAEEALGVSLTASQSTADPGDIVTFTAVGNGGDGNYQYKFIINDTTNDKWYKLQDYSSNNTIQWTATTAGIKRIMVDIKDGTGKTVGKNVAVVVNGVPELSAKFTASSYEVNPGDVVTLIAEALGGSGRYNYKFIINDKTDDKWYRLQDFGANNVITWTATTPGTKRLMVDVVDSDGRKYGTNITITVK